MTSTIRRWAGRTTVCVVGGAALALATPLAALAHVEMSADTTAAGSYAVLTLSVPHGCEGSPTTRLTLSVPAGINEVTPTVDAGWKVSKTEEKLDEPLTLEDGDQITSRTSQVVWQARTPLPDGFRAAVSMQVELPEDSAGQTLSFPVVQTCEKGHTDWTQVPAAGVDEEDLETPAPSITVTDATGEGHDHAATTDSGEHAGTDDQAGAEVVSTSDDAAGSGAAGTVAAAGDSGGTGTGLGLAGLVAGLLGLAAGVTALLRTRGAATSRQP